MKAVVCREFSGPQGMAIEEVEPPRPAADEVRIAVHAASVNYIDLLIARGLYQVQPNLPYVAGAEGAGEVVETGADVTNVAPGDRVAVFHLTGAFAEEIVAKHWRTIPLPDGVSYDSGAATLHNYVAAAYALSRRGHLKDGETLVVHGATGGVGLAAVELGKMWGARVIACVGADEKMALAGEYGAETVVNYARESIRDRVLELTGGRGADVVFDPVGGDAFDQSIRCVAWEGRILIIGFASGEIPQLPLYRPLLKNASVVGVNTGAWPEQDPAAYQALAGDALAWAAAGKIKPKIGRVLPLEDFRDAMEALDSRAAQGRAILHVR
jgi:NADPH2:quinone reductase